MIPAFGKMLVVAGAVSIVCGLVLILAGRLGIERVTGDIVFKKGSVTFFFPIVSCLLLSLLLTLIMTVVNRLHR